MSKQLRLILAVGAIAAAVVVFVVIRPGSSGGNGAAEHRTVSIRFRNGHVEGGLARPTLKQGDHVSLVVDADVSDEVHLHGYDIMRDVAPGRPARIDFRATVPGRFETELEHRKIPLAELEVQP